MGVPFEGSGQIEIATNAYLLERSAQLKHAYVRAGDNVAFGGGEGRMSATSRSAADHIPRKDWWH